MGDTNEALRRLVAQAEARTDVLVGGVPMRARQLMAEAAARLSATRQVVSVASPIGELGLSALIAQLSGRPDLDEQDDAVLELGFKRLRGEGQTVLMVMAPEGVNRSALRYLQHVARHLPGLTMVVHDSPALDVALEEAGLAALRDRLRAAPRIDAVAPPERVPERVPVGALAVVPPADLVTAGKLIGAARPGVRLAMASPARRPALWVGAALGAAALAGIVVIGMTVVEPGRPAGPAAVATIAHADIPLEAAIVPEPRLAPKADPADVTAAIQPGLPALTVPQPIAVAKPPLIALAPPLPALPPLTLPHPEPAASPPQRVAKSSRVPPFRHFDPGRREATRFVQTPPYWSAPRYPAPAYDGAPPYEDVPPRWVRREPPGPYLGTFAMDPYGMRTFRYDP